MNDIPRTPDDAMIKSWIASLELLWMATESAVSYAHYLANADGEIVSEVPSADDIYMQLVRDAQKALKVLLSENEQ